VSTPLAILGVAFIVCGTVLQIAQPANVLGASMVGTGIAIGGAGHAKKHREATVAKKAVVDLEKTATNLRAEIQSITGVMRKP
jgi:hypothetical protein